MSLTVFRYFPDNVILFFGNNIIIAYRYISQQPGHKKLDAEEHQKNRDNRQFSGIWKIGLWFLCQKGFSDYRVLHWLSHH